MFLENENEFQICLRKPIKNNKIKEVKLTKWRKNGDNGISNLGYTIRSNAIKQQIISWLINEYCSDVNV